jgi:hypothetical protein
LELTVPLPAAEAWRLHRSFAFISFSASIDRQAVSLVEETVSIDGSGNHQVRRTFKMVFKTDPVPAALRGLLKTEEIEPILREVWVAEVHDHEYSYQFTSDVAFFGDKLKVSGRQWFVPLGENKCAYMSRAEVRAIYFPGMNGLLERAAAEKLEWAMSTFGDRAVLFLARPQQQLELSTVSSSGSAPSSPAWGAAVAPRPGSPSLVLTAADVWLPVQELYGAAAGVASAPVGLHGGSPLAAALELADLAGDGRVPCACCCACVRRVQQLSSSYASLGRDAALRDAGGGGETPRGQGAGRRESGGVGLSAGPGGGRSLSVSALRAPVSLVLQRLPKAREGKGEEADTAPMSRAVPEWRADDDEAADEEDFGEIID